MLTNIIAHRLAVIALAEQIAELRQGLAMMMIVLRGGQALVETGLGGAEMAGQQGRVAFQSEVMFDAGPHFRILLRGQRHQARDQSLQDGALLHGKRRFAGGGSA